MTNGVGLSTYVALVKSLEQCVFSRFPQPWPTAYKLCLQREVKLLSRMKLFYFLRWAKLLIMSLIAGTVFLQLTDDTVENGISMLGVLFYSLYVMYGIIAAG